MRLEWSAAALADLDRFAAFLHEHQPTLAAIVAQEILTKARVLEEQPHLGYPIGGHGQYRQIVLEVLRAKYIFRYRVADDRLVILRVWHGREQRDELR
jgi:plasmid stabilization system protein ParE